MLRGAFFYAVFVVYGSLVPLAFRYRPLGEAWDAFLQTPYLHLGLGSRADWVANILLYIPLSFLATGGLARHRRAAGGGVVVFILCTALAIAVEFTQLFFPPRTVSLNDLIAELIGSMIGIAVWHAVGNRLLSYWDSLLHGGREAVGAFIALYTAAYLLFAVFPYDFVLSPAELAQKLASPNRSALWVAQSCGAAFTCGVKLGSEALVAAPLGVFLGMVAARMGVLRAAAWGLVLGMVIEGLQVFLASGVSQGASILTRAIGVALGLAVYRTFNRDWLVRHATGLRFAVLASLPLYVALLLALIGFYGAPFEPVWSALAKLQEVRFLPFYYHYFTSETQAMYSLLIYAGAYGPIGLMVWLFAGARGATRASLWTSALAAFFTAAVMETLKLFLHGKRSDPTDALIAAGAAALVCFVAGRLSNLPQQSERREAGNDRALTSWPRRRLGAIALLVGLGASSAALAGWLIGMQPREHYIDEGKLPQLPAPATLPPAHFTAFRFEHPRLPSPTPLELDLLRRYSPTFLHDLQARARGGWGELDAAALQQLVEPGSVDLALLHGRLLELQFSWRGHEQVKPLALAYDWLYNSWSSSQREALQRKLADGCEYLINYIRSERLSPYNVILYNSPLQPLMACSIALYHDDPRGAGFMAFTTDLWKNRVLPVWRQVMGKNGGWHEGGEYVGIGIGQAIYQLPVMWRRATGEDLFAAEPELRGFLDFLVYRRRPDGTDFRWGDGAFFTREVPDAQALALEYGHAAYYSLKKLPDEPRPTAWPWGPLTDRTLYDPGAIARLPLTRYFDGIGLVVARSDWSPQATYVTFKAGDNYWSHSHLDQGAFTIYKGGPLAIDSGLYGPKYGSDHHMNYSYQTVAHNTITVTDPADTVPAPGPEQMRPVANDGGQRRVGSGWGIEAAPLDRVEWEAKREIYHTGSLEQLVDQDGVTLAVADVTPAYTNSRSGEGTFSARTRRVERFWRTFGYDRVEDVVVVFDNVIATEPTFRKRWLLHTLEEPRVRPDGVTVQVAPLDRAGRGGGRLDVKVLLPKPAMINALGGRRFEFFAGDKNYDEGGKLAEVIQKLGPTQGEPGAWRVEVSPLQDAAADLFLVVLLPSAAEHREHKVRLLESDKRVGCEVSGAGRTTRWWFDRARNAAEVEVVAAGHTSRYRAEGRSEEPPAARSWIARLKGDQ